MKNKQIENKIDVFGLEAVMLITNCSNKKLAIKALNKFEKEVSGARKDDLTTIDMIKKVRIATYKNEDNENYFYWGKDKKCKHCSAIMPRKYGFVYYF